ncbi:HAMP domain-containing sensor histidine kinase [Amycolatopsis mongoliensis]|uniref:histidine kinase n=1 Tax=Amycolatopsis mongoliensis TaxID=715475 RepID=A0A9Y2JJ90_9PSEU|nr:HAMP domain-containing sensor histidine kinase [Amycolatopsis sp. 4-36]WIX98490.1 HAMP domain-containing sensor histidine kinase [Amycolatopsis sp. 4-36]
MTRVRSVDERLLRRTAARIGVQTAVAVVVTVLVLSGIAIFIVLRSQQQTQSDLIETTIAHADDVNDPPAGMWLVMDKGGLQLVSPGLPRGLPVQDQLTSTAADRTARSVDVVESGREYRVRTEPSGPGGAIQAVLDLGAAHAERSRLLDAFLVVGGAGLLLAAGIGVWLGRRAMVPMARALALQRRFVADAGHELRTPLTLISTRAQLLRRAVRSPAAGGATLESDVDDLVRDTGRLAEILDDMLISVDPRESAVSDLVDLPGLAAEVAQLAGPAAAEGGVDIVVATEPAGPVRASEAGVRRAITALVDNAVRHAASQVRLTTSAGGGELTLEVADDGPGIDPAVLPTLFARFATGPADHARGGARRYGLGLALVSEIAARHGGSVTAVNTEGTGAAFRLTLPIAGPDDRPGPAPRRWRRRLP